MNTTRREFIAAGAFFGAANALGAGVGGGRLLRFGVLSDVHVSGGVTFSKENVAQSCKLLRTALKWMDAQGVDAVVMPGDLADLARVDELQAVADTWNEVFPGGKGGDGRAVEHVLIYGNHESYPSAARGMRAIWTDGRDKVWKEVFGEDFADLRVKTVKGFDFLCASWGWENPKTGGIARFAELAGQCAARARGRPFFEVQHAHLKGTCHGPYVWGHDDGASAAVLAKYPNAVALSGHSHWHLGDERAVWQGAFTSIGCGSLRYTGHNDEDYPPVGPENGNAPWPGGGDIRYAPGAKKAIEAEKIMEYRASLNLWLGCQGLLVDVREGGLAVRRHEFRYGEDLGPDWEVPLPAKPGGPFDLAKRAAASPLCEYKEGVKLESTPSRAKDRAGIEHDVLNLKMPVGKQTKGAELAGLDVGYVRNGAFTHLQFVVPSDFNRPQKEKSNIMYVQVRAERVPSGAKPAVRPLDWFGRAGRVVSAMCLALGLFAAPAFAGAADAKVQAPFEVDEGHRPKKVMGRDYWTMLESHPYTDPYYQGVDKVWQRPWNNRALCALPVFRDCGLVVQSHRPPPPGEKTASVWRTVFDNFGGGNSNYNAVMANMKRDKPLVLVFSSKRNVLAMCGDVELDHDDWRAFKASHPNLVGTRTMCEWGNDLMCMIGRTKNVANPARRAELEAVWAKYPLEDRYGRLALCRWFTDRKLKTHYDDLDTFMAFRAAYYLDHVAAAWGAKTLTAETTNTTDANSEYRWDVSGMFVRGAARQFGVPWCWYEAVFYNGPREDGTWMNNSFCNARAKKPFPEGGVSASSQRRLWYYAYLNGANAVESESWTYCCFTTNTPSGKAELTVRGRNLAAFHDFTAAHPGRGVPYAPVAVLVPFAQGYTCMGGRAWMRCKYTPGDFAVDSVFFSVAPGWDRGRGVKVGDSEGNLHNSRFAMMYDVLAPDSPQPKDEFRKALFRYPAAILAGDYRDTSAFEDVLADYERAGGRLVRITADMLPPFRENASFISMWRGELKFPKVEEALEKLQRDLFPFEVSGDCQFGANRTADGWWLWVFNNKGVRKFADTFERIDHKFDVTVTAKKVHGAAIAGVTELVTGMKPPVEGDSFSFPVPAGDFAVFAVSVRK